MRDEIKRLWIKVTSRKFLLTVAAFITAHEAGIPTKDKVFADAAIAAIYLVVNGFGRNPN